MTFRQQSAPYPHREFVHPSGGDRLRVLESADEIAEKLRQSEAAGLNELSLVWPMDHLGELMRDFTEVMKRL